MVKSTLYFKPSPALAVRHAAPSDEANSPKLDPDWTPERGGSSVKSSNSGIRGSQSVRQPLLAVVREVGGRRQYRSASWLKFASFDRLGPDVMTNAHHHHQCSHETPQGHGIEDGDEAPSREDHFVGVPLW